ncbi:MAG: CPBP family intramembrane metalloprotease [Saccharospirillaceae bacterium]|nr:CPBP family intramembrane metalloprotease [Pseudomonadales bacterium]NRB81092.1 CPBP family intramembrane metalloprotease [Saccharospirillaceae bacterium]
MNILEIVLWAFFILTPLYVYFTHEKEKQNVIKQLVTRSKTYIYCIMFMLLPTLLLLFLVAQGHIPAKSIGLIWQPSITNLIAVFLIIVFIVYSILGLIKLRKDTSNDEKIIKSLHYVNWLMPRKPAELKLFVLGLSVSAGVCEELLFRGYLLNELMNFMPVYAAVILSSLMFGLPHLYQGPIHVLRTACMGAFLAILYLVCDSIYVPIVLHILFDMYGGFLAYLVLSRNKQQLATG